MHGSVCARMSAEFHILLQQAKKFAQKHNLNYENLSKDDQEKLALDAALHQLRGDAGREADPNAGLDATEKKRLLAVTPLHFQVNKV